MKNMSEENKKELEEIYQDLKSKQKVNENGYVTPDLFIRRAAEMAFLLRRNPIPEKFLNKKQNERITNIN